MMNGAFSVRVMLSVAVGAWLSVSLPAAAQIGSGWREYAPPKRVQTRGCGTHSAAGGVETFGLTCASTAGDNRAEQRIENDYSSGTRQFEGEVRVVSLGGNNVSLKQTFMPSNGAFLMIAVSTGGRLYSVGDNGELATGIIGRWVKINTIHDVAAGTHRMYADGVLKVTKTGARPVAWHDKYGTYRLGSGRGPIVAEWRNVKYFRDGTASGGTSPPPATADGGAAEVGSPDAGGLGGAGGSGGGTGGSGGGTGGSGGGTGGSGGAIDSGGAGAAGAGGTSVAGNGGAGGSGGATGSGAGGTGGSPAGGAGAGGVGAGGAGAGGRGGRTGAPAADAGAPAAAKPGGGCALGGPAAAGGSLLLGFGLLFAGMLPRLRAASGRPSCGCRSRSRRTDRR